MRKRDAADGGEDTVEKAVEGLAESILKEDEEKRKEELVRAEPARLADVGHELSATRTCSTSNPSGQIGILSGT